MVETIQQIQKIPTPIVGPSTFTEGWNTTWLGMPNTTRVHTQKYQEVVNSQGKLIKSERDFLDIGKQML